MAAQCIKIWFSSFHAPDSFFAEANFPRFAEPIPNITVTIGRDALLACVVDNLKGYKVGPGELRF